MTYYLRSKYSIGLKVIVDMYLKVEDSHDEEAGKEAVWLHVKQMAAVLLDGELPAQPLGRDGAGDDGRQGQAASQTQLGYTLKSFLCSGLTEC